VVLAQEWQYCAWPLLRNVNMSLVRACLFREGHEGRGEGLLRRRIQHTPAINNLRKMSLPDIQRMLTQFQYCEFNYLIVT
jgi:hypothetical protein